jgi:hypothetical protein
MIRRIALLDAALREKALLRRSLTFALCALFTLVMIHHYVFPLGAILYTEGKISQDCDQMIWNLWHVAESVSCGRDPYLAREIFYPDGVNLAHHTLAAGFVPVTLLVKLLSGGSPFYPIYAYRIIVWLSYTLILFGCFILLREIGNSRWAAILCAVGYTFSAFFLDHALHLNLLAAFFFPLTAVGLIRLFRRPSGPWLFFTAFTAAISVYFSEYSLSLYLGIFFYIILILLFAEERARLMDAARRLGAGKLLLALVLFVAIASPFVVKVLRNSVVKPHPEESAYFSADLAAFVIPSTDHTRIYDSVFSSLDSKIAEKSGEHQVFIGFPIILMLVAGLIFKGSKRHLRFAAVAGLLFLLLSLGPHLKVLGLDTGIRLPYALLMRIPPFDSGRTPVRFVALGFFFLMILAAAGATGLQRWLHGRMRPSAAGLVMALLLAWTIAENYAPIEARNRFEPPHELAQVREGPVLNLPLGETMEEGYAELLQTFHHQPILTGYAVRATEAEHRRYDELRQMIETLGPELCRHLTERGVRNIIINPGEVQDAGNETGDFPELEKCGINRIDLRRPGRPLPHNLGLVSAEGVAFPRQFPLLEPGRRISLSSEDANTFLWYGWSQVEPLGRWTSAGRAAIAFSIQEPRPTVLKTSVTPFVVPGRLTSQRVFVSLNGQLIAELQVNQREEIEVALPLDLLQRENTLVFTIPDARTPESFALSDDRRLLGIFVNWFELSSN